MKVRATARDPANRTSKIVAVGGGCPQAHQISPARGQRAGTARVPRRAGGSTQPGGGAFNCKL
jgi:hypothetical protein